MNWQRDSSTTLEVYNQIVFQIGRGVTSIDLHISQPVPHLTCKRCYICNGADHLAKFCKVSKSESKGSAASDLGKITGAKKVVGDSVKDNQKGREFALMDLLFSDSGNKVK